MPLVSTSFLHHADSDVSLVQPGFKRFFQTWIISTLAVLVAVYIVPGIQFKDQSLWIPFITSLVLGVLNAFLRPAMMFLAFPLVLLSLGLFMLVINALVLYVVGLLLGQYFEVDGFWSAFFGALIISIVTTVLNALTGVNRPKVKVKHTKRQNYDDPGNGPVIDV